jgi:hypothetical protein
MTVQTQLKVTSHVTRDLLASAASFKTEAAVVWEYVVNSLQYVDAGVSPRVQVTILLGRKGITIADNGCGMSSDGLAHFFRMHGENLERLAGRAGRGKFGTGKSAAFGIANTLRVDTVRDGKRNVVSLSRDMINGSDGHDIPLNWEVRDKTVDEPNGTVVSILDINLDRVKQASIIEYVERHLQAFRASAPAVAIDSHVCSYREPETAEAFKFEPSPSQRQVLGDVILSVKVARAPLPQVEQGIAVTSGIGNLVAIERAGIESKEFGNYLFGDIDVPALDKHSSPIEPYDPTRSLQLNPHHPLVGILLGFIGSKLEEVRATLVRKSVEARKTEQARRLAQEADKIADILNEDFRRVSERLQEIRAASARRGSALAQFGGQPTGQGDDDWVKGLSTPGAVVKATPKEPSDPEPSPPKPRPVTPEVAAQGAPDPAGDNAVDPVGGIEGKRRRPRGGFKVEYRNLGKAEDRSVYDPPTLTILINLDHPLVAAALGEGSAEDKTFRRLSYEIAFSEYAMGLGYEIAQQDPNIPADDLLYEVRSTLNRVSSSAVGLYR